MPLLERLARGESAPGRLHALWTLDGLGQLDEAHVVRALGDAEPGVREAALQLAEPRLGSGLVSAAVLARATVERDPRVRFQLLLTLGDLDSTESRAAQERLLFDGLDDPWMHVAALSAGPDRAGRYLGQALATGSRARARDTAAHRAFFTLAASAVAAQQDADATRRIIQDVAAAGPDGAGWWQAAVLEGIGRSSRSGEISGLAPARPALIALAEHSQTDVRRAALGLLARVGLGDGGSGRLALDRARALLDDASAPADRRADAVTLLALGDVTSLRPQLEALVEPRQPEPVQVAALKALSRLPGEGPGTFAITRWPQLTPGARSAAVDLLLADRERQWQLVRALEAGTIQSWGMTFWQKRALIMHRDDELRAAARALLEEHPERRAEVVNRYASVVEQGGDAARGEAVFARTCAVCHKLGDGTAADLGPDLVSIRHRPPLSLLVDILSPNQSIAQGYETYIVERTNGRTDAGTLAEQTPTTITLRQAGQPIVIPRTEIKSITMTPQSSMPADLDQVISEQEMADLIAYLTRR